MVQYILECISFQLVFLIIYDLFLKRETFFQWNRLYLIGTYIISMVLPWIKIEAMKTTVPETFQVYPEFLWNSNDAELTATVIEETSFTISWEYVFLFGGMFLATVFFGYKLYQIFRLRLSGEVHYFKNFTRIIISNSSIAFSFFKSIFLGDKVIEKEHESIVQHELVHIRQRHSYDLMFFELMRIVGWFNPLVYIYQRRVSELHEFIADAQVAKTNKKEQYELLLSQVFETQNISFINQFFKTSLIKKRIVMLTKQRSKQILQIKYLLLVPIILGMLAYTSSEAGEKLDDLNLGREHISQSNDDALLAKVKKRIEKEVAELGSLRKVNLNHPNRSHVADSDGPILSKEEYFESALLFRMTMQQMAKDLAKENAQIREYSSRVPLPSTARYESYVSRKKAFQILDENLKFSIKSESENIGYDIRQIEEENSYRKSTYELEVANVRDLTGKEITEFNAKMDEIFEDEDAINSSLILKDKKYRFQIFAAKPVMAINTFPKLTLNKIKNQNDTTARKEVKDIPFAKVDKVPVFPGCESDDDKRGCFYESMREHIRKNFNYPKEGQKQGIQGRVAVMFTINTEGRLSNVKVRGPHKLLEDEAVRIISRLPKFAPGVHEGKEVGVIFSIPITFKLDTNSPKFQIIPENEVSDEALQRTIQQYNQLVQERNRLLQSADDKNPIIVNLDQQLTNLKHSIDSYKTNDIKGEKVLVPFATVDEVPIFPGCEDEDNKRECFNRMIQKHIAKNFRYPQEAQEKGIQGRVSIMFTVGKDGAIQNVRMRGPDGLLEKEAARIIGLLPKMKPGKQKGKAVNVPFSIPMTFKLNSSSGYSNIKLYLDHGVNPAYIIDGVEATKAQYEEIGEKNVESISILNKGASIKKYGDKGKNGVIEVKTKNKD